MSTYEQDSKARDKKIRFGRELEPIVFEREKTTRLGPSDTSTSSKDFEKIDTVVGADGATGGGDGGLGNSTLVAKYVDDNNEAQQATFVIVT